MEFSLIVDWPALAGSLLLLGFPPSLWLSKQVKGRLSHHRAGGDFNLPRGALVWQNWVDFVRAYVGCYLLFAFALEAPEGREWELVAWRAGILFAVLIVQTVRRHRGRAYFLAPVFFVWGAVFFLAGPLLTVYGIVASVLVASVATNLEWKFPVMAVVVGVVGYLIDGFSIQLALTVVWVVFPLIISFCGRGRLVFLMKDK